MRKLIGLVVTLVLLFAADSAARGFASARMSAGLAGALNLEEEPEVLIGGFPFLWELIRGDFENISVSVDDFGTGDVVLDEASVTLREVSFAPIGALTGDIEKVSIESARGTARVNTGRLADALEKAGSLVGGLSLDDLPGVSVEGRTLSLGPLDLELPVMTDGMSYESAELIEDKLVLRFTLDEKTLRF